MWNNLSLTSDVARTLVSIKADIVSEWLCGVFHLHSQETQTQPLFPSRLAVLVRVFMVTALGALGLGSQSQAAPFGNGVLRAVSFGAMFSSIEARPIFNTEANLLSTPVGIAVIGEAEILGRFYWTAELSHYQLGSKVLNVDDGFYITNIDFERRHMKSTAVYGGGRYYDDPFGNSWYAGVKLGFQRQDSIFSFDSSKVIEVSYGLPIILESGYRMVLSEQMTGRIGVRLGRGNLVSQNVENEPQSSESLTLAAVRYQYESVVDLGLAYHF